MSDTWIGNVPGSISAEVLIEKVVDKKSKISQSFALPFDTWICLI
jgi:hypothetical protein